MKFADSYVYDTETTLYYLQSRYYDPAMGRFINADALVSTGQGILGNNMFAYCLNSPPNGIDPTGERVEIWPILFGEHDPGFIHRKVQAHIVVTGLFRGEFVLPGAGRADILDPATGEIWEIKHGGSSTEMQSVRTIEAMNQIERYINNKFNILLQAGHAGAFTGAFYINYDKVSYLVTYDTPEAGVILYYVQQMQTYEPEAAYTYVPSTKKNMNMMGVLWVPVFAFGGSSSVDSIKQEAYSIS